MNYTKHKWHDAIVAYAKGRPIQCRKCSKMGFDFGPWNTPNTFFGSPSFENPELEWRVKPEPVVIKYRNALMKNSQGKFYVEVIPQTEGERFEEWGGFVRWIGEEMIYTVEE